METGYDRRLAKAQQIAADTRGWRWAADGRSVEMPSQTDAGVVWRVTARSCTCPDYWSQIERHGAGVCKHVLAMRIVGKLTTARPAAVAQPAA